MPRTLLCTKCNKAKAPRSFQAGSAQCRSCRKSYEKTYRAQHKQRINERIRVWSRGIREAAVRHYGGVCTCCREQREEFLSVEPLLRKGAEHPGKRPLHRRLKQMGFPEGYQVLCRNCVYALSLYDYCPHQRTAPL